MKIFLKETHDILNKDLEFGPLLPSGYPEFIQLSERLTKTRRGGKNQARELDGKVYLDEENPDTCPVRNIVAYQEKKTEEQLHGAMPFLLCVNLAAEANPDKYKKWYTNNRMGVNQIGTLFKKVFGDLGVDTLKEKISATSSRKQLVQAGAEAEVPGGFLSKMLGQKNLDSKLDYLRVKNDSHKAASLAISRRVTGKSGNFSTLFKEIQNNEQDVETVDRSKSKAADDFGKNELQHGMPGYMPHPCMPTPQPPQFQQVPGYVPYPNVMPMPLHPIQFWHPMQPMCIPLMPNIGICQAPNVVAADHKVSAEEGKNVCAKTAKAVPKLKLKRDPRTKEYIRM